MSLRRALTVFAVLLCAAPVSATTITNGSFEADSFPGWPGYASTAGNGGAITGWTLSDPNFIGLNPVTSAPPYPCCGPGPFGPGAPGVLASPDGGQWAFIQDQAGPNTPILTGNSISQGLTGLSLGTTYTISYFDSHRNGDGGAGDTLIAEINGVPLNTTTPSISSWGTESFNFVATAGTATLAFVHGNITADQTVAIDGVSVTAVPEPSTIALLGLGAVGLFLAARCRK